MRWGFMLGLKFQLLVAAATADTAAAVAFVAFDAGAALPAGGGVGAHGPASEPASNPHPPHPTNPTSQNDTDRPPRQLCLGRAQPKPARVRMVVRSSPRRGGLSWRVLCPTHPQRHVFSASDYDLSFVQPGVNAGHWLRH